MTTVQGSTQATGRLGRDITTALQKNEYIRAEALTSGMALVLTDRRVFRVRAGILSIEHAKFRELPLSSNVKFEFRELDTRGDLIELCALTGDLRGGNKIKLITSNIGSFSGFLGRVRKTEVPIIQLPDASKGEVVWLHVKTVGFLVFILAIATVWIMNWGPASGSSCEDTVRSFAFEQEGFWATVGNHDAIKQACSNAQP
jgi:hypothetical protein